MRRAYSGLAATALGRRPRRTADEEARGFFLSHDLVRRAEVPKHLDAWRAS
jgi:hypothetical protein